MDRRHELHDRHRPDARAAAGAASDGRQASPKLAAARGRPIGHAQLPKERFLGRWASAVGSYRSPMHLEPSAEQNSYQLQVAGFASTVVSPRAAEIDETAAFPK